MIRNVDQSPQSRRSSKPAAWTATGDDLSPMAWLEYMTDYSKRQLTYATDRLPAVSGMAARFHAMRQCSYYAGLWADDFPACLGWISRRFDYAHSFSPLSALEALGNGVPSWSWASVSGTISWPHLMAVGFLSKESHLARVEANIELLEIDCKPATQNRFGEVCAGSFFKLRGMVVDASMECDGLGHGLVRIDGFEPQLVQPDCLLTVHSDEQVDESVESDSSALPALRRAIQTSSNHDPSFRVKGSVICMLLYSIFGDKQDKTSAFVLVLGKTGTGNATYERVASATGRGGPVYASEQNWKQWEGWTGLEEWSRWEECFSNAQIRDICIV